MVSPVLVGLTRGQEVEVLLDETLAPSQEKGDLAGLHPSYSSVNRSLSVRQGFYLC